MICAVGHSAFGFSKIFKEIQCSETESYSWRKHQQPACCFSTMRRNRNVMVGGLVRLECCTEGGPFVQVEGDLTRKAHASPSVIGFTVERGDNDRASSQFLFATYRLILDSRRCALLKKAK